MTTMPTSSTPAAAPAPVAKPAAKAPAAPAKKAAPAKSTKAATPKPRAAAQPKVAAKAVTKAAAPAAPKDNKVKKPKLVRDSFTIPKDEYTVIETLKQRAAALGQPVKKSELLRAGLKALAAMSDSALRAATQAVPSIKTGRPKAEPVAKASRK
ncbi:MAG: hypothetical protein E6Q94_11710 [Burkholderiaceae bacterium]|nr:MAG: hypothetical protein E6Q94_11710 [Burkholderiaceae bacterium]